jgi:hypothetical protein
VIKKYPNRRLYDTDTSTYITLADSQAAGAGAPSLFVVRDAKTNEDLTRSILLQIILEEEAGGAPMFSEPRWPTSSGSTAMPCRASWAATSRRTCRRSSDIQAKLAEQSKH